MADITQLPEVKPLYSEVEIAGFIGEMAKAIAGHYKEETPLIVPLLRGSFIFAADLVRALSREGCQPQIDFLTLSSYGTGMESSGVVDVAKDMQDTVEGKAVLLVDDILESGRTLTIASELMQSRGAKSVATAVLLDKPNKRAPECRIEQANFTGIAVPDKFVVGYGLDYASHFRELPYIGYIDPAIMEASE